MQNISDLALSIQSMADIMQEETPKLKAKNIIVDGEASFGVSVECENLEVKSGRSAEFKCDLSISKGCLAAGNSASVMLTGDDDQFISGKQDFYTKEDSLKTVKKKKDLKKKNKKK